MRNPVAPVLVALFLAFSGSVHAQSAEQATPPETAAPAEGAAERADSDLSLGEPVQSEPGIGDAYLREEFGDWAMRCIRSEDGNDPCQLYQLLEDQTGNAVAEITVFPLEDGQQAEAGATVVTPLETLLTQQVTLTVDQGQAKRYPFTFCAQIGCISRIGLLAEEVDQFRRGAKATIRIVPAAAPDQEVLLDVSLSGFTAGYAAVVEANEATQN